jgi:hypothetical protein
MATVTMQDGYTRTIGTEQKNYITVTVPAAGTSDIVLIPYCRRLDLQVDTTDVTVQATIHPTPDNIVPGDIDFTGAVWEDWDGISFISPNVSAIRASNTGVADVDMVIRCS